MLTFVLLYLLAGITFNEFVRLGHIRKHGKSPKIRYEIIVILIWPVFFFGS